VSKEAGMTEGLFSAVQLGSPSRAGYRLSHLEVFNWGTFDKRVWRLTSGAETALLTGDIGSGKSTLVDAMTTLLLPANKISYNKAAGAESKERTLRSYVEGHYKSESIESTGSSRPVGLRDNGTFSVILGVFTNEGYDETVTVAQVFHQREQTGQPDRFYVTSPKELSVEADFTDFGADLNDLRRRLRAGGAAIFNHGEFPKYATSYRRLLGIKSEQAMELFHQTVSMKSVGNLNEFVRSHMLEPVDASERVRGIVAHFEDLTKAHEAVKRARDQLEALRPLVATADKYDAALARRAEAERQRDAVRLFFAELRIRLLTAEIDSHDASRTQQRQEVLAAEQARKQLGMAREALIEERAGAGGDRISELERAAEAARQQASERRERRAGFDDRVRIAGLAAISDAPGFATLTAQVTQGRTALEGRRQTLDEQLTACIGELNDIRRLSEETRAELASLAGRTSNLPSSQLDVRAQLCAELGIDESDLPFAGELLDVADDFAEWRGAAERVLRGFALSLLVPQRHYDRVSEWVNQHRLTHRRNDGRVTGSRLVYERVAARRVPLRQTAELGLLLLSHTLEIKDGPFREYLHDELVKRADYGCVDSVAAFRSQYRAVTREGQVRSGERHEKDDRSRVDDPRSWVLGWVNERKVAALTEQLIEQQHRWDGAKQRHDEVKQEFDELGRQLTALANLEVYSTWAELDHEEATARAEAADAERSRLVAGSSELAEIALRLAENATQLEELDHRLKELNGDVRVLTKQIEDAEETQRADEQLLASQPHDVLALAQAAYSDLEALLGSTVPRRARDCAAAADRLGADLQSTIDRVGRELGGYTQSLLQYMNDVRRRWPEATTEMDASVEARDEFRAFHDRVAGDDLPRFEADFKRLLNTETIRELAAFHTWLKRQADDIAVRVARINEALGAIDYSPGHYITLVTEGTVNQEVRDFRAELRNATTDVLSPDDDHYTEQRFLDVQRVIDRFRGRDGHADADRAWTRRVTDVRNWFTFAASERDKETDEEKEHYQDSDGKSGGQKEKLAYTILAASLAYQFGLEWGAERSKDFRFTVIDEAFGRGSDASTRYALELFAMLGLQLLIVTPLQKVHVIEPFVKAIGFVDNPDGNYSRLQTLTIEEFRARRAGQPS
jgi:uncharacterized protein YPO0396